MAKNNSLLGDKARGSAGNVTFATTMGIDYFKQKAEQVSNPQTDGQRTQRNRMKAIVAFFRLFAAIIDIGYREMAVKMSAYNAFAKFNVITGTTVTTPDSVAVNVAALNLSKGSLGATPMATIVADDSSTSITVTWNPAVVLTSQSVSDVLNIFVWNITTGALVMVDLAVAIRSAGTFTDNTLSGLTTGDTVRVITFFSSTLNNKVSDSDSQASVVVA